jgi:sortase A
MRRFAERFLLLAGIAMLGVWAWSEARVLVWQDWGNWAIDRGLHQQSATTADYLTAKKDQVLDQVNKWLGRSASSDSAASSEMPSVTVPRSSVSRPSIDHNGLVGRLSIPRLNIAAAVREGAEEDTLAIALGHIPYTALPGQKGNVGIAGHRDKLFRGLRDIRKDDVIEFETLQGKYVYEVESLQIVKPTDVTVLKAGASSELTLVTCYPFNYVGPAPKRFIVKARQLPSNSPAQELQKAEVVQPLSPKIVQTQPVAFHPAAKPETASKPGHVEHHDRIGFDVGRDHSRQLAPGIWFGVTDMNPEARRINGWMWLMPDRRTIWLRDQSIDNPVVFYSMRDGKRRELRLTKVTENSVAGYLAQSE